jgi:Lipase (class 3)
VASHIIRSLRERGVPAAFLPPTLGGRAGHTASQPHATKTETAPHLPAYKAAAASHAAQRSAAAHVSSDAEKNADTPTPLAASEGKHQSHASLGSLTAQHVPPTGQGSHVDNTKAHSRSASAASAQHIATEETQRVTTASSASSGVHIGTQQAMANRSTLQQSSGGGKLRSAQSRLPSITLPVMPKLRSPVPQLKQRNWSIVVTGHSLGAGVAAFVLLWLKISFPYVRSLQVCETMC